jgi:hypothetical protein
MQMQSGKEGRKEGRKKCKGKAGRERALLILER